MRRFGAISGFRARLLPMNIMIDNARVVIQAIRMVVDALRAGQTSLKSG